MSSWEPVVYLTENGGQVGYKGPGWYWGDPADAYQSDGHRAVTGPYATKELAQVDFRAYCEAMTI